MLKKWLIPILMFSIQVFASELDFIIPPEIKNDDFYFAIYRIAKNEPVKTILEIGSSSGEGSTEAFVRGIFENPEKPSLFCMELSAPRFQALQNRYRDNSQVVCYNVSSIPLELFPSETDVLDFMRTKRSNLSGLPEDLIIGWLRQDIEYVTSAKVPTNGIEMIKNDRGLECFDVVLIDGSEFTGFQELNLVYGAKFILLDDICCFKNYYSFQKLSADSSYELIEKNESLRNGYAIFKKR